MDPRYIRNIPALTEAECALLRTKTIFIAGCGGTGGYLLELMLRMGVGTIRIADGDRFEPTNLNRQLLSETSLLGQSKALAAGDRGKRINPEVRVEVCDFPLTQENVHDLIRGCDAVLDGLDSIESRKVLAHACRDSHIPYVFGATGGWVAQAAISMPGDGLIDSLYPDGAVIRDKSVLSFTPALCASLQAALCTKLLTGRPVETGTLLHFDLLEQELTALPIL